LHDTHGEIHLLLDNCCQSIRTGHSRVNLGILTYWQPWDLIIDIINSGPAREVYTVSRFNRSVRFLLEERFPQVWVSGEISNLSRPASGHLYFSLKDAAGQIRCALFRQRARRAPPLRDGQEVIVLAQPSLYEARGDYQLIVEQVEETGLGQLQRAFEALKARLQQEGLFDADHKRPIPTWPQRIGVITSPSGAAVRDVLSVLGRRCPGISVLVYPVPVQGEGAGARIAQMIQRAGERAECDVLLLVRGGGSLEDLWAFNEEGVARAIHDCPLPLISGVGHEVDFSIADFVADLRAPTPSVAAERASIDHTQVAHQFAEWGQRLSTAWHLYLRLRQDRLRELQARLDRQHPGRRLQQRAQRLDELRARLERAYRVYHHQRGERLAYLQQRLQRQHPGVRITPLRARCQELNQRLHLALQRILEQRRQRLASTARGLHALSPLQTLGRGYAILRCEDGSTLHRAADTRPGQPLEALLAEGRLQLRVENVDHGES